MGLDQSRDYLVFDDPVRLGFCSKLDEGRWDATAWVEWCQITGVTKDDLTKSPALLNRRTAVVNVWARWLCGLVPKAGDKVVQEVDPESRPGETRTWVVESVGEFDRDGRDPAQRYRLVVVRSTGE